MIETQKLIETQKFYHHTQQGTQDYVILFTMEYSEEDCQWVGICHELDTTAHADTLEQVRVEVIDAVSLQLSEAERLGYVWAYLRDNRVSTIPTKEVADPGFSLVP